jgi:mono/diheme cytochrome c family protein
MNNWRSVAAVAATYFYFLLFAQFAFLEGLIEGGLAEGALKPVMGAMGFGGLSGCLAAPFLVARCGAGRVMRLAFLGCAVLATVSIPVTGLGGGALVALLIGVFLGIQTVTLAGCLPSWVAKDGTGGIVIGLGTGLAYALCNVPAIFQAPWASQSALVAGVAILAALLVPGDGRGGKPVLDSGRSDRRVWAVTLLLMALVWLDSAAFFIIQHTEEMKKATWGSAHLWRNAGLHFAGAVVAGFVMDRGSLWRVLFVALALLSLASQMVNHGELMHGAGWLYPLGVSLYSVALVMFPGFLSGAATQDEALRRAAGVFAVAGWIGSALGVGMAENLHRVPGWFVLAVGGAVVVLGIWLSGRSRRKLAALGAGVPLVLGLAWWGNRVPNAIDQAAGSSAERGHEVYLSEGCIHCHSRYVRPGSGDVLTWGPTKPLDEVLRDQPVTIGNRRQGPDLMQVGLRRSAKWLELHFRRPRLFDANSTMPSYAYLFDDRRGPDIVNYLGEVDPDQWAKRIAAIAAWSPAEGPGVDGEEFYGRYCTACHGAQGRGDGPLAREFARPPADLAQGPFIHTALARSGETLRVTVARVVKFGVPGTDMPGHELLTDAEALGVADWVLKLRAPSDRHDGKRAASTIRDPLAPAH